MAFEEQGVRYAAVMLVPLVVKVGAEPGKCRRPATNGHPVLVNRTTKHFMEENRTELSPPR